MKKTLIVLLMINLWLITACGARATTPMEKPLVKVNACNSSASASQMPFWYAAEKGLFQKYGLEVNLIAAGGGSKAATGLATGDLDICQVSGTSILNANLAGEDLIFVGGLFNDFMYSLMVAKEIKSAEDLKGKGVAIAAAGGVTETAARLALRSLGLTPDQDVALLSIGEEGERLAAMQSGRVAGGVIGPPNTLKARQAGFWEIVNLKALNKPYVRQGIATRRSYLEQNREVVANFLRAISEAIYRMKTDPASTKAVMAKYLTLDEKADAEILEETYQTVILGYLPDKPVIDLNGIQAVLDEIRLENPKAESAKPEDFVDLSVLQELEQSGFFEKLRR